MQGADAGDFAARVEVACADVGAALRAQGLSAADVVHETIYTSDVRALVGANDKRLEYYRHVCLRVEVIARRPGQSPN